MVLNKNHMSYSQFSDFLNCEAQALAKIKGEYEEPKNKSYLMGSYVDAYFSGELDKFIQEHQEDIFGKGGKKYADFVKCDEIINTIESDEEFSKWYKNGETQVTLNGVINGVDFTGRLDFLTDEYIADMKLMKDINDVWIDGAKIPFWEAYHYDIQASIYQYLEMQRTGIRKPYYLVITTKEEIPCKYVFKFSDETLEKALDMVKNLAPRYDAIKKGLIEPIECGKCRYYKINHKFTNKEIKEI